MSEGLTPEGVSDPLETEESLFTLDRLEPAFPYNMIPFPTEKAQVLYDVPKKVSLRGNDNLLNLTED